MIKNKIINGFAASKSSTNDSLNKMINGWITGTCGMDVMHYDYAMISIKYNEFIGYGRAADYVANEGYGGGTWGDDEFGLVVCIHLFHYNFL